VKKEIDTLAAEIESCIRDIDIQILAALACAFFILVKFL